MAGSNEMLKKVMFLIFFIYSFAEICYRQDSSRMQVSLFITALNSERRISEAGAKP
jgi:hypothetical protein